MIRVCWVAADRNPGLERLVLWGGAGALALAVFGLPPVGIHGPLHPLGIMDPLCGMTRATRFLARGELGEAWRYNPASFLLAAFAVAVIARAAVGRLSGRWLELELVRRTVAVGMTAILVALLWFNQQQHAALLS